MNLPTVLIALVIAALFVLAVRFVAKHGVCDACDLKGSCRTAKKTGGGSFCDPGAGCSACRYYEYERKAPPAKRHTGA